MPQTVPTIETLPDRVTIDQAARAFLAEREESAATNTQRKNRYVKSRSHRQASSLTLARSLLK